MPGRVQQTDTLRWGAGGAGRAGGRRDTEYEPSAREAASARTSGLNTLTDTQTTQGAGHHTLHRGGPGHAAWHHHHDDANKTTGDDTGLQSTAL